MKGELENFDNSAGTAVRVLRILLPSTWKGKVVLGSLPGREIDASTRPNTNVASTRPATIRKQLGRTN